MTVTKVNTRTAGKQTDQAPDRGIAHDGDSVPLASSREDNNTNLEDLLAEILWS